MRGTGSRSRQNSALSFYHHTNHILPRLFINRQQLRGNTKRGAAYRGLGTITRVARCCRQVLQIQRISYDSRVLWIGHVVCDEQSSTDNRARSKKSSLHKYFPTSHYSRNSNLKNFRNFLIRALFFILKIDTGIPKSKKQQGACSRSKCWSYVQ